jgi:hypothetical protein
MQTWFRKNLPLLPVLALLLAACGQAVAPAPTQEAASPNPEEAMDEEYEWVQLLTLGDAAGAFPFKAAAEARIINDMVGPYPVLVYVNPDTQGVYTYLRQVDDQVLTFVQEGAAIRDRETGSTWHLEQELALDGPLQGQALRAVPYIPAFASAWGDFYPDSRWYGGD